MTISAHRKSKAKRANGPPFVQLYRYMVQSPAWLGLSCPARAAYVQLASRYNGANNGSIGLSVRILAAELIVSRNTAARALVELEDADFIETTFYASFTLAKNRKASEYRLTCYRCDKTGMLPSKKFLRSHRAATKTGYRHSPISDTHSPTIEPGGQ